MVQPLQRWRNFGSKYGKVFAHLTIFLALFSVALWDATIIIDDYVNDNRYTLVKLSVANDTFPFLENTSIYLSISYAKSLFKTFGTSDTTDDDFKLNSSSYKEFIDQILIKQTGVVNMSQNDRSNAAKLLSKILSMDRCSFLCIIGNNVFCSYIATLSYLKHLMNDRFYLENLEENLWNEIREHLMWRSGGVSSSDMTLMYFDDASVCVEIHLSAILTPTYYPTYYVGIVSVENTSSPPFNNSALLKNTIEHTIEIFNKDYSLPSVKVDKFSTAAINLRIHNHGVYDKTKTTKCANKAQALEPNFRVELSQYLEVVVKECNCLPFFYRRQFKAPSTKVYQPMYCTAQLYNSCFKKAQSAYAKKPVDSLPPCITVNNQISFTSTAANRRGLDCVHFLEAAKSMERRVCWSVALNLRCNDLSYAVYEERFQLTLSELLSQVGGDLGLYTGISIFGVWQFLAFIYDLQQRRKKRRRTSASETLNSATSGTSEGSATNTVFTILSRYFESTNILSGPDHEGQSNIQMHEISSETNVSDLENKMLGCVKKELADIIKMEMQKQQEQMQTQMETRDVQMQAQMEQVQMQMQEMRQVLYAFMGKQSAATAENKENSAFEEKTKND